MKILRKCQGHAVKFWRDGGKALIVMIAALLSFRSAVADWNIVPTGSMRPSIVEGDRIYVNKLAYGFHIPFTSWQVASWGDPQRGDVVVFLSPENGTRLVKRVIGVSGDKVEMRNERLFINGEPVKYDATQLQRVRSSMNAQSDDSLIIEETLDGQARSIMVTPRIPARRSFDTVVVPEGKYFMMGDNRDNSRDSRWFGCVDKDLILGKSTRVVISLDPKRYYLPRIDRFFHPLP